MAKAHHAKVLTLFERIMEEDNAVYTDLFRPNADRILWFGPDAGKPKKPADVPPFPRQGGPLKYYNRVQYFGDHVFAETHDAVFEEHDERVSPNLRGCSMPVLAVCTLDPEGFITRFEEFADTGFLQLGKRPIPAPARRPSEVTAFEAPGEAEQGKRMVIEAFDRIMRREDVSHLFTTTAIVGQLFAGMWKGKYKPIGFNKKGELVMGSGPPDLGQYTNRRQFAGSGWAIELHTATVPMNTKFPERRYALEVAVLVQSAADSGGKFGVLMEYAEPKNSRRVADAKL